MTNCVVITVACAACFSAHDLPLGWARGYEATFLVPMPGGQKGGEGVVLLCYARFI